MKRIRQSLEEIKHAWELEMQKSIQRGTVLQVLWDSMIPEEQKVGRIAEMIESALADIEYDD